MHLPNGRLHTAPCRIPNLDQMTIGKSHPTLHFGASIARESWRFQSTIEKIVFLSMLWESFMVFILEYFQIKGFYHWCDLIDKSSAVKFWKYKDTHNASIAQVIEEIKDSGLEDINDLYRLDFVLAFPMTHKLWVDRRF